MAERKDRDIIFYRTILATAGGSTSATAVDWHLKIKDTGYNVCLTKNHSITVSMQKVSTIHKLIFQIQQIFGFHVLNSYKHF